MMIGSWIQQIQRTPLRGFNWTPSLLPVLSIGSRMPSLSFTTPARRFMTKTFCLCKRLDKSANKMLLNSSGRGQTTFMVQQGVKAHNHWLPMDCKVAQSDQGNCDSWWWRNTNDGQQLVSKLALLIRTWAWPAVIRLPVSSMLSSSSLAGRRTAWDFIMLHRQDQTQAVTRVVVNLRLDIMILLSLQPNTRPAPRVSGSKWG